MARKGRLTGKEDVLMVLEHVVPELKVFAFSPMGEDDWGTANHQVSEA